MQSIRAIPNRLPVTGQDFGEGTLAPDCPDGPFETDLDRILQATPQGTAAIASAQEANAAVPIEVSRIREGGVSFFQGGLMNEGDYDVVCLRYRATSVYRGTR